MPHRRETQMVCNLHFPTGTTYFRIWNIRAFLERTPYQFPGRMKNSPCHCPGQHANQRPPAHPDFLTNKESHTLLVRPYRGSLSQSVSSTMGIVLCSFEYNQKKIIINQLYYHSYMFFLSFFLHLKELLG